MHHIVFQVRERFLVLALAEICTLTVVAAFTLLAAQLACAACCVAFAIKEMHHQQYVWQLLSRLEPLRFLVKQTLCAQFNSTVRWVRDRCRTCYCQEVLMPCCCWSTFCRKHDLWVLSDQALLNAAACGAAGGPRDRCSQPWVVVAR